MVPNFIIAGAEKSGTSSLVFYLMEHEDVYIPVFRELHFFDDETSFSKGVEWYTDCFAARGNQKVTGECTPLYMFSEGAAQRISGLFPDMRLIFILRNPVDRAYSNYWHQVRGGREALTFAEGLEREEERISKGALARRTYAYLNKGFYYRQLRRFADCFPMDKVLVLKFEDLKRSPQKTLNAVYGFLGVAPREAQMRTREIKNRTRVPRSRHVQHVARKLFRTSRAFRAVSRINLVLGPGNYPPLDRGTRERLTALYREDVRKLETLTGIDFGEWGA